MKKMYMIALMVCVNQISAAVDMQAALADVDNAYSGYESSNPTMDERHALLDYLKYYRSFYQLVTPPPRDLIEKITPAARAYVTALKKIVEKNKLAGDSTRGMTGTSRLSSNGEKLYEKAIDMLQKKFSSQKPCCGGVAQLIDRTKEVLV